MEVVRPASEIALSQNGDGCAVATKPISNEQDGTFCALPAERPLGSLIDIQARCTANQIGDSFPVRLSLEVGTHDIVIRSKPRLFAFDDKEGSGLIRLRVGLRRCFVKYRLEGASVDLSSKYQSRNANLSEKYTENISRQRQSGLNLGLAAKGRAAFVPAGFGAEGEASGKFGGSRSVNVESKLEVNLQLFDVQAIPDGWKIGTDVHNDRLFGRYFDSPTSECSDTFRVLFEGDGLHCHLTLDVTVRDGLYIERLDGREATGDEREKAALLMREAIAGLRVEKQVEIGMQRKEALPGETSIARQVCYASRPAAKVSFPSGGISARTTQPSNVLRYATRLLTRSERK